MTLLILLKLNHSINFIVSNIKHDDKIQLEIYFENFFIAKSVINKLLLSFFQRLAQCMHPALPSGVHLKALDTYDIIFKCMGTNRLAQELFLYSAGLFPLLGHAAMNVRPNLLTVYETHFVPLGKC